MTSVQLRGVQIPLQDRFSEVIRASLANGSYESAEAGILEGLLEDGDRVLELGTGLGFLAAYCAKRLSSSAVLTVEADPEQEASVRATFAANDVSPGLLFAAVSADGGPRTLRRHQNLWSTRAVIGETDLVRGVALGELIREHRPTVLVIDIEGGESDLAPTSLVGVRAILVECHSARDLDAVLAWTGTQGFSPALSTQRRVRLFERI